MSQTNDRTAAVAGASSFIPALKIGLLLLGLGGIVFGLTLAVTYAPQETEKEPYKKQPGGDTALPGSDEQAVRFFNTTRGYSPPYLAGPWRDNPLLAPPMFVRTDEDPDRVFTFSLQDRLFQGVFEQ